jgi:hypothetical protein
MRFAPCPCAVSWFWKVSQVAAMVWEFLKGGVREETFC